MNDRISFNHVSENFPHHALHSAFDIGFWTRKWFEFSQFIFIDVLFWENYSFADDESQLDDDWQNDENEDEFMLDDMILSRDQMDELFATSNRRNGVKNESLLWPNKTVPVLINNEFSKTNSTWIWTGNIYEQFLTRLGTRQKEKILSVLEIISSKTCIKFKQLAANFTELSYVNVSSRNKCSSNVGYRSEDEVVDMSLNIKVRQR